MVVTFMTINLTSFLKTPKMYIFQPSLSSLDIKVLFILFFIDLIF